MKALKMVELHFEKKIKKAWLQKYIKPQILCTSTRSIIYKPKRILYYCILDKKRIEDRKNVQR